MAEQNVLAQEEKRKSKLTEKGFGYQINLKNRARKRSRRIIEGLITNVEALMGLDKNVELVTKELVKINELFIEFGDVHEEIQELYTEYDETDADAFIYNEVYIEVAHIREQIKKWIAEVNSEELKSVCSSKKSKGSRSLRSSRVSRSTVSSVRAKAIESKARQAELESKIAQLDEVQAAQREAERVKLKAECLAAAAANKVYEAAVKEEEDQYLGSDDPDEENHENNCVVRLPNDNKFFQKLPIDSKYISDGLPKESQPNPLSFWEKMEIRMTQPAPCPTPFDGDPKKYLRFRASFRDQIESRISLSESEKMSYLMSYTTGKAKQLIENYQGLPHGCRLALQILEQRFGQVSMIVQALKDSVISGPKIKSGDSTTLLAFSDKLENCCWAMSELKSSELDCTTNLKYIYDRLPESLQRRWRKLAKAHREKTGGKEPTLVTMTNFIREESEVENDPVYNRVVRDSKDIKPSKQSATSFNRVSTLATDISTLNLDETASQAKNCKICEVYRHQVSKCPVFLVKSVNWRRRAVRENRLCYRCLSDDHLKNNCPEREGCTEKECSDSMSHHSLLHIVRSKKEGECERHKVSDFPPSKVVVEKTTVENSVRGLVLLKVIPVKIIANNGTAVTTYGLLDSASVSSLISSQLAERLKLGGVPERVSINTVTHNNHKCQLQRVSFKLCPVEESAPCFTVFGGLTVKDLNISRQYCPDQLDLSEWPHLVNVDLRYPPIDLNEVSVLIGQDVPQAHIVLDYVWGDNPQSQPYAMKTPFGWSIAGPTEKKDDVSKPVALSVFKFECDRNLSEELLLQQVERFWAAEKHGFENMNECCYSVEDKEALRTLEHTTKLKNNRYEVGLLWRKETLCLPNNRKLAEKRLWQLKRKFDQNPEFAERYISVLNDYIEKGYARMLTPKEAMETTDRTWYLPHHGVINPKKAKVRVVYDAAAEYGGTSLNKELLQGPQLNNSLIGVLLRFRKENIAVASDIESMFHRVACRDEDTDTLRFLWWNGDTNESPRDYKMLVHLFGKVDSPCIAAWALQRTAADNQLEFGKEVVDIVKRNFYVDDCLYSKSTVEEAANTALQLITLLRKGNFRLTKFMSTSKEVLSKIPTEDRTVKDLDLDDLPIERALGIQWDVKIDALRIKAVLSPKRFDDNTRRGCLSTISSTFDPFGLIAPVVLPAKLILQKTWQRALEWDDSLPDDLLEQWTKWKGDLPLLSQVSVPRCFFRNGCSSDALFQLHHFSDASEYGYGTVSYLRKLSADRVVECSFIMAKSRTAPLQYVSVPRLELQAATIAVRVHRLIMKEIDLQISSVFFWTDSRIVLQYINNRTRRFKTYVSNRVAEIQEASQPNQWRHCPGHLNPADDASRGLSASQLLIKERWFSGPAFLTKPEDEWPNFKVSLDLEDESEVKVEKPVFLLTAPDKLNELLLRYSSWLMLQRKIAWLLKFKTYLLERTKGSVSSSLDVGLSPPDLENATIAIVKLAQREVFRDEIKALENQKMIKNSSDIVRLNPVLKDGVLRVGGRLSEAPVSFDAKFPMIVPTKHHITRLLILSYHQRLAHAGQDHILACLREKFWIPKGRSVVRNVVRSCLSCKKQRAKSMEQMMAALPAFRTTAFEPCFTHTGVDYFGPLNVKRGRSVVKRWGAIFTCMNSRAVHLELASSLETDCFINVLRRFINRRGTPESIHSDNGTNFVGAEKEIKEAICCWNQQQIQEELLQRGCKWVFQPPKASHASGVWERLIRSTKTALKSILGEGLVDKEVLVTLLTEIESRLNSRPLCPVSDDLNDCEPLTPNHLQLQRQIKTLPPGVFVKEDVYLRKKWRET